jgi:hypothetical protein
MRIPALGLGMLPQLLACFAAPNRLDHHPLHFVSAYQSFQDKGKLHGPEFQKVHDFGEIVRR